MTGRAGTRRKRRLTERQREDRVARQRELATRRVRVLEDTSLGPLLTGAGRLR